MLSVSRNVRTGLNMIFILTKGEGKNGEKKLLTYLAKLPPLNPQLPRRPRSDLRDPKKIVSFCEHGTCGARPSMSPMQPAIAPLLNERGSCDALDEHVSKELR